MSEEEHADTPTLWGTALVESVEEYTVLILTLQPNAARRIPTTGRVPSYV